MIDVMKRFLLSGLGVVAALAHSRPRRAPTSPPASARCRAGAARDGISAKTLDVAFNGLEPDPKVLDLQKQQPEFKTPVWDYVDGLVDDDRVADGKAAMAREARALARAEEKYGVSRTMLAAIWGVESNFGQEMGKRPLVQSLTTLACMGDRANYFRSELMATLKIIDRGDVPAEKLNGLVGGSVRADAVHALDLPAPGGRLRGRRAARHCRFGPGRARLDGELSRQIGLAPGPRLGLRGQAARRLFGPIGAQGQAIHVVLGVARR